MRMISKRSITVASVALLTAGIAALGIATAGDAAADTNATAKPAKAAEAREFCHGQSLMHDAVVRENPDTNSQVIRHKNAGDFTEGPCHGEVPLAVLDTESGVTFISRQCACASDGWGWIDERAFDR